MSGATATSGQVVSATSRELYIPFGMSRAGLKQKKQQRTMNSFERCLVHGTTKNGEWIGKKKFKKKNDSEVEVTYMSSVNSNTKLHQVGESYGVKKPKTDAPHWSHNGK